MLARLMLIVAVILPQLRGQDKDSPLLQRVQTTVNSDKEAMNFLKTLVTVFGQRLTGSQGLLAATDAVEKEMKRIGLVTYRQEWPFVRSSENDRAYLALTWPNPKNLSPVAIPWTGSTGGVVTVGVAYASTPAYQPDLGKVLDDYKNFFSSFKEDAFSGKIVLFGTPPPINVTGKGFNPVLSDEDIKGLGQAANNDCPTFEYKRPLGPMPADRKLYNCFWKKAPAWAYEEAAETFRSLRQFSYSAFKALGAVAVVLPSKGEGGLVSPTTQDPLRVGEETPLPVITLPTEQYNQLALLATLSVPAKVELEVRSIISTSPVQSINLFGEIRGSNKPQEVVVFSCHLDSMPWSNGATDDAVGCAALIEAARTIKRLGLKPGRTLRFAMFAGEEQGLLGSRAYVASLGLSDSVRIMISLDNGAGKIRGIVAAVGRPGRDILQKLLARVSSLGAGNLVDHSWSTGRSDELAFAEAGFSAFSFLQDPLNYESRTHHTNVDTLDYVPEPDFRQMVATVVMVAMEAAQTPELLPRRTAP